MEHPDVVSYLVAVRPPDWTEPWHWIAIYETEDYETAEMLCDALDLRWGNVGPYRQFGIRSLRHPVDIGYIRGEIAIYQRIVDVVTEYERSYADASWIVMCEVSDQDTRIAEQYAYCLKMLKFLEDDTTQGDVQKVSPEATIRTDEPAPENGSVEGDATEDVGKVDKESQCKWPKSRVEKGVLKYLKKNNSEYERLVPDCLNGLPETTRQFRELFGPTAIAEALGDHCTKQHVSKCDVYRNEIRPVLAKPPTAPKNWQPPDLGSSPFNGSMMILREWAKEHDAEKCPSHLQQS